LPWFAKKTPSIKLGIVLEVHNTMAHVWKTINVVVCLTTNRKQKQQNNYLNHSSHPMLQQSLDIYGKHPKK
jgi:hypothetical protein